MEGDGGSSSSGGEATSFRDSFSPPLTPPNSPTNSGGPLRSALRRALSVGQAQSTVHSPLFVSQARGGGAADGAALMSHLPSSANLMALEEGAVAPAASAQTRRQRAAACAFRVPLLLLLLYGFVLSLDLLTTSFRLMAGRAAGTPSFQGNTVPLYLLTAAQDKARSKRNLGILLGIELGE